MRELAQIASQVTGEIYDYDPISDDEWVERWKAQGRPEWAVEAGLTSYQALRAGELDVVSDDYEKVTGRKAATIRQVITDLADEMPLETSAASF
jgi:NAD(P)H dehydrogenase (quinone)